MFFVFPLFGFTITHFLKSSSLVLTFCFMEVKLFLLLIALLVTLSSSNSTSSMFYVVSLFSQICFRDNSDNLLCSLSVVIVFESRTSVSGRSLLSAKKRKYIKKTF